MSSNKILVFNIDIKCDPDDNDKIRDTVLKINIPSVEWMESAVKISQDNFGDNVLRIPFKTTNSKQSMDVEDELDEIDGINDYDVIRRRFNLEMRAAVPKIESQTPLDTGATPTESKSGGHRRHFTLAGPLSLEAPSGRRRRQSRRPKSAASPASPDLVLLNSTGEAPSKSPAKKRSPKKKKESVLEKQQRERREAEERRNHRAVLEIARNVVLHRKRELDALLYNLNHELTMSAIASAAAKKKKHKPVLGLKIAEFTSKQQPVVGTALTVGGVMTVDGVEKPLREKDMLIKWYRDPMGVEVGLGGKTYTPVPQDLGCTLRVVVSIPSQPFTADFVCRSTPVELPKMVIEQLGDLLRKKGRKRTKVAEFEVETLASRDKRLSVAGGVGSSSSRTAVLSINPEKLKYKVAGKTLVRTEHGRGVYAIADAIQAKVVHVNFANEMMQTAFCAKTEEERNCIVFVINAFCAHTELARILHSTDKEEEDSRGKSNPTNPGLFGLSRIAQLLRSGLATVDRAIVVPEPEEVEELEEVEANEAAAAGEAGEATAAASKDVRGVSSAGETGANQERIHQMLTELQASGTLDPRDAAWLGAIVKGGACAADQRRSGADVLEHFRQIVAEHRKQKKKASYIDVKRKMIVKFGDTIWAQYQAQIRQMLPQCDSPDLADISAAEGGSTGFLGILQKSSSNQPKTTPIPADISAAGDDSAGFGFGLGTPPKSSSNQPKSTPILADISAAGSGSAGFGLGNTPVNKSTPDDNDDIFGLGSMPSLPARTQRSTAPPAMTGGSKIDDVFSTIDLLFENPPAVTAPKLTAAPTPAATNNTAPDASATAGANNDDKHSGSLSTVTPPTPPSNRKPMPAASPSLSQSPKHTPKSKPANHRLSTLHNKVNSPSPRTRRATTGSFAAFSPPNTPVSLDLDRSKKKGDYIWDRNTCLWWNPQSKYFFNSKSKLYSRSPNGPFLKFDSATRKLKPV